MYDSLRCGLVGLPWGGHLAMPVGAMPCYVSLKSGRRAPLHCPPIVIDANDQYDSLTVNKHDNRSHIFMLSSFI